MEDRNSAPLAVRLTGGGPGRVGEMMSNVNNSTYDHNINVSDGDYEFNGVKTVKDYEDGRPSIFNHRLDRDIKFNSLHFQGAAKNMMGAVHGNA